MPHPARYAVGAARRLNEMTTPKQHHIVQASATSATHAGLKALAHQHGAKLVTGSHRHLVAHFDAPHHAAAFHRAAQAAGHADAALHTVRESVDEAVGLTKDHAHLLSRFAADREHSARLVSGGRHGENREHYTGTGMHKRTLDHLEKHGALESKVYKHGVKHVRTWKAYRITDKGREHMKAHGVA